jgi:hypothetical protein
MPARRITPSGTAWSRKRAVMDTQKASVLEDFEDIVEVDAGSGYPVPV